MDERPDVVLTYLISTNLMDHESQFRAFIEEISSGEVGPRELAIATVATLMLIANMPVGAVMRTVSLLKLRTAEQIAEDGVLLINGSALVIPKDDNAIIYDLATMRVIPELPPGFTSTIYSLSNIAKEAKRILG